MAKILIVIAPEGFQDKEYADTKRGIEEDGHTTMTASTKEESHGKYGSVEKSDTLLSAAKEQDYSAVVFIGGPGSYVYFDDKIAQNLAKSFAKANKVTAAICAAPSILANAGLLQNRTATCFPSQAENLQSKGAQYTGNPLEQDKNFITANGPETAYEFGKKVSEALLNSEF